MVRDITRGMILIKEDALLPETLYFKSEVCIPRWRLVQDFDAGALDRAIQMAGWSFFTLAGELKATVFGIDRTKAVCRAIEKILAYPKSADFNALEITGVDSVGSQRFPIVNYITISARLRHIQESVFLFRASDPALSNLKRAGARFLDTEIPIDKTSFLQVAAN